LNPGHTKEPIDSFVSVFSKHQDLLFSENALKKAA